MAKSSVERVRDALLIAGHADTIETFPDGTRSAEEAANAIGCTVAQIVKSLIFRANTIPVLVLTSGANQVDVTKVNRLIGTEIERADGRWVRDVTGFAIGGVAPIGHLAEVSVVIDKTLQELSPLYAAAGSPKHVFRTDFAALVEMTRGRVADVQG